MWRNPYVESNEYTRIIEENGGAGLNADTSFDYTEYFYSLPSNRIELCFCWSRSAFCTRCSRVLPGTRRGAGGKPHAQSARLGGRAIA